VKRIHLTITGHVQGVGFRYFCQQQAGQLGITGYARNLPDGTVEVEAQGDADAIEQFLQAVSHGPRQAEVTNVERKWQNVLNDEDGFGR
jgi:acylphosphatase